MDPSSLAILKRCIGRCGDPGVRNLPNLNDAIVMVSDPTNVSIPQALQIAHQYFRARQYPEAKAIYQQILQVDLSQPKVMHMLGLIDLNTGQLAAAEQWLRQSLALDPND